MNANTGETLWEYRYDWPYDPAGVYPVREPIRLFLACRRLSLVFEWVFLGGFLAAVPFSLAARHLLRARRWYPLWQVLATALAFAAFFWSPVVYLYLRVR